jgi:hypothetical protein
MTKEQLAARLDGREYRAEITIEECKAAAEHNLVVIFGASDDLVEFRGAVEDEIGAYYGVDFILDAEGLVPAERNDDWSDEEMVEYFRRKPAARLAAALWCAEDGYSWTFRTEIPHATFNILEDGDLFCRGIVVDLRDLAPEEADA